MITDIEDPRRGNKPLEYVLEQNYPNPFNPTTIIGYQVGTAYKPPVHVKLRVYNILGQRVITLVDSDMEAGYHSIIWKGTDESGALVSSGVYLHKMEAGNKTFTKKMMMLK